jgi:ABC-type glycerol-3-phosphate transport system substrate-binding protein
MSVWQMSAETTTRRAAVHRVLGAAAGGAGALGLLAACGAPAPGAPEARPANRGPVTIDFNTWYDVVTEPIVPLFAKFEQEHNVKINADINPANRDASRGGGMPKYTAWYVSGTAPDVVNGDNFSWSTFYNGGNILELTEFLKRDKIDLARQYALMGSETWCGKTYAMPFDADPRGVYYNKTLIKQVGAKDPWADLKGQWTFDDMLEIAVKTTKITGNSGTDVYGLRMDHTGMSEAVGMFVWSWGTTWADFDKMRYTLDSKDSIDAHAFVYDWVANKKVVMPHAVATELGGDEKPFGLGRAAMRIRAAAAMSRIRREINDGFDWDIAPMPGRRRGQPGVTIVSGNPHTVSKTSKHPDAAYDFIKFLAGPEVQGFWAREKIQLPTLKPFQDEFVKDPTRHVHVFADAYKVPYGIHFRHNNTVRHYGEYSAALTGVYAGTNTVSAALTELTGRLNNEVEYGACQPYKGMAVPIKP